MRAVFLVGLPGSGKTSLALQEYVPRGFVLLDDPKTFAEVEAAQALGKDLVVCDPHLVYAMNRTSAEAGFVKAGFDVEWVFFENDPLKAQANLDRRGARDLPITLDLWTKMYQIPEGVPTRPIWTP